MTTIVDPTVESSSSTTTISSGDSSTSTVLSTSAVQSVLSSYMEVIDVLQLPMAADVPESGAPDSSIPDPNHKTNIYGTGYLDKLALFIQYLQNHANDPKGAQNFIEYIANLEQAGLIDESVQALLDSAKIKDFYAMVMKQQLMLTFFSVPFQSSNDVQNRKNVTEAFYNELKAALQGISGTEDLQEALNGEWAKFDDFVAAHMATSLLTSPAESYQADHADAWVAARYWNQDPSTNETGLLGHYKDVVGGYTSATGTIEYKQHTDWDWGSITMKVGPITQKRLDSDRWRYGYFLDEYITWDTGSTNENPVFNWDINLASWSVPIKASFNPDRGNADLQKMIDPLLYNYQDKNALAPNSYFDQLNMNEFMRDYRLQALQDLLTRYKNPEIALALWMMSVYDKQFQGQMSGLAHTSQSLTDMTNNYATRLQQIAQKIGPDFTKDDAEEFAKLLVESTMHIESNPQFSSIAKTWDENVFKAIADIEVTYTYGSINSIQTKTDKLGDLIANTYSYGDSVFYTKEDVSDTYTTAFTANNIDLTYITRYETSTKTAVDTSAPNNSATRLAAALRTLIPSDPNTGSTQPTTSPNYQALLNALTQGGALLTSTSKTVGAKLSTVTGVDDALIKLGDTITDPNGGGFIALIQRIIGNFQK